MPITALYAALLTPLFIILTFRVIGQRHSSQVSIGNGDDRLLLRRIRAHANFAEYVPLALLLIGLSESVKADPRLLHAAGILLLIGRMAHAFGVSQEPETYKFRQFGMVSTLTVLAFAALLCLAGALGFMPVL